MCVSYWISNVCCVYFFFFFKQKTAYEMRISDWSSDVCSSDLRAAFAQRSFRAVAVANLREIALQARALAGLAAEQLLQVAALLLQRVLLAAQLHFLELAQKIGRAHV